MRHRIVRRMILGVFCVIGAQVVASGPVEEAALVRLTAIGDLPTPAERQALLDEVARDAGVAALERAIDSDVRFARGTSARSRALFALSLAAFAKGKGGADPDAQVVRRVEDRLFDLSLRRDSHGSDREVAIAILVGRIQATAQDEQMRLGARFRSLRDSDDPHEVITYLAQVLPAVEKPGPEDAEWALRLIARPESFPPKVREALSPGWRLDLQTSGGRGLWLWAGTGEESQSLRMLALQARWDMGHMADDLALLDGLPEVQRQAAYSLLLRRLQRDRWVKPGEREWLTDDALVRVLRQVETYYTARWSELEDWYVPTRLLFFHAYMPERPEPVVVEVLRVERALAAARARHQDPSATRAVDKMAVEGRMYAEMMRKGITKAEEARRALQ